MKKVLFTMGLALLFAGCSDDYTDWAQPKQNAQEAALSAALNRSEEHTSELQSQR